MKLQLKHIPIYAGFATLVLAVLIASSGVRNQQDLRSRAANPATGELLIDPKTSTSQINVSFPVTVKINVGTTNRLNIARFVLSYNPAKLSIAQCVQGNDFRGLLGQQPCAVDNQTGKATISLEAGSGTDPDGPNGIITLATLSVKGVAQGEAQLQADSGYQFVVKDTSKPTPTPAESKAFAITTTPAIYTIGTSASPTGSTTGTQPSRTPTPGAGSATRTPTPTPGSTDPYRIPIGTKNFLTITIGSGSAGDVPRVRFAVQLLGVEKTPEIMVRLKVVDLLKMLTSAPSQDSCQNPRSGQHYFINIPMVSDGSGTYTPKPNGQFHASTGGAQTITSDGWVPLSGVTPGQTYALYLKGPKHRDQKMVGNVTIQAGSKAIQDFDWIQLPLEPGDLPDPNRSGKQDCTVNSIDLSLIISRIGKTEATELAIADVNFDGIVNGNDVSKVVHTLSTKPDDDQ